MSFQNLFKSLTSTSKRRRPTCKGLPASRPGLETLEDRTVPAFLAPAEYPVGGYPQAVISADFNNDTLLDLAVANTNGRTVSVLLGNGDGTFQDAVNSAAYYPSSLSVGDFNNDTILDLAATSSGVSTSGASILLGNGDGSFQNASTINFGFYPISVAVGDFNADGNLDLGVASSDYVVDSYGYYGPYGHYEGKANVLLGNGSGAFAAPIVNSVGSGSFYRTSAAVADFDGDGKDDFAMTDDYSTVRVLLADSNGSGNLLAPTNYTTGAVPLSILVGDVNGDGIGDLATLNNFNVSVLLGNGVAGVGDGTFQAAQNTAIDFYTKSLAVGDFNADGKLDLAAASNLFVIDSYGYDSYGYYGPLGHYEGQAKVLLGTGNGQFTAPETTALGVDYAYGAGSGDFDGDGFADLAVTNAKYDHFIPNTVSVLINDQSWPSPPSPHPPSIRINDVTVMESNRGSTTATFTLTLSASYNQPITVHYATADGSATAGSDYTATSADVTFAAGLTSMTIPITVLGDRSAETTEAFVVNLTTSDASIGDGQGVCTILDDEPRISINDVTVTEGNTGIVNATFTVSLSIAYDVSVKLDFATGDGSATASSDYQASSAILTIPAGQTAGTITVQVNGDRLGESNETFFVDLSNMNYGVIADHQGVATILDDEPRISISDVSKVEGRKGKTTLFTFTVTLSVAYDQEVTVSYRTVDGSATTSNGDYVAKTGTVTFAPGETTRTITIEVKGDSKRESNETFYLDLFGNSSNSLFTKNRGIGTILNDD